MRVFLLIALFFALNQSAAMAGTPVVYTTDPNIEIGTTSTERVFIALRVAAVPKIQCESDEDCPGFNNYCFAGECNQDEYLCEDDDDCPGFNNYCFAGSCNIQEPLCEDDDDCPGFANYCFAGECQNP